MSPAAFKDDLVNRLIRYPGAIAIRLRIARLRALGVSIGEGCWIRRIRIPRNPWDIVIEDRVALDDEVVLLTTGARRDGSRLMIGAGTYINRFTMFDASDRIEVGSRCLVGPFCYITDHDHGIGDGPTSNQPLVSSEVRIGNNVWIGAHVLIMKGVTIGSNAVIGAGAVVTRNVQSGETVAGVPARRIRRSVSALRVTDDG